MTAKKATKKIPVGTDVVVKEGMTFPELPDFSIAGWTGVIREHSGKKADPKYIIEWDQPTLDAMPAEFAAKCEEQNLYHLMVCLERDAIEPAAGDG